MSKPEKQQDIRPEEREDRSKADGGASKIILMNIITTAIVCAVFLGVFYIMQKSMVATKPAQNQEEVMSEDETADDQVEKGIILDLGEFTMNLADTSQKRYLKVAVALEVTKNATDMESAGKPSEGEKKEEGASDEGGKKVAEEMEHFKPAIRDAVITTLSSKMADEVSTTTGKELAKDQIKEAVDAIFAGEREVIRVSFGQFIIQ